MKTTLIFDFDGTLADTRFAIIEAFNHLSGVYGYRSVDSQGAAKARDIDMREIFQELGISWWKSFFVLRGVRNEMRFRMSEIQPFDGVISSLEEMKRRGKKLGIITSNSTENVNIFLKTHGLEIFDFVDSSLTLFGKDKVIRKVLKQRKIDPAEAYYVGDETRDIQAASRCGLESIAVTWGFSSKAALAALHPHHLVSHPKDWLNLV